MIASNPVPYEDAAILFRYSENFANGFGIVYNPGGPHVDGATDMLFMLGLAVIHKFGLGVDSAAALVNAASLGLICALVYWAWSKWSGLPLRWAFLSVLIVLVGPVWLCSVSGFGTVTFAAACTLVALGSELASRRITTSKLVYLGILVTFAGMIRPEGFILGGLIVTAQAIRVRSWRFLLGPALASLALAGLFVAWRVWYFDFPFPNPFYKKSGGSLHIGGMARTAQVLVMSALPCLVFIAAGLLFEHSRRRAVGLTVLCLGWGLSWTLISNEMNWFQRFQYPIVPVLIVLSAPMWAELRQAMADSERQLKVFRQVVGVGLVSSFILSSAFFVDPAVAAIRSKGNALTSSPQAQVAMILAKHREAGVRRVAVTEAGFVAWKSGWIVTDLWGLNDKEIAHHGYLSPAGLRRLHPEVIFAHLPTSNAAASTTSGADLFIPTWTKMTEPLLCYTAQANFTLIGQWGDGPNATFAVLADPNSPDFKTLERDFASLKVGNLTNSASNGILPVPDKCA
jgi:hypothetical protein